MIFRRFLQRFKQQPWGAIATELVIVVVGVFIGIQVSNWNEERAEARLGRDYVQRLIVDLENDQVAIRAQTDYYTAVLESIQLTDELMRAADPDPRELVVNAYRATELSYAARASATWDQVVSSGHLGLLPARAVESKLPQYYAFDVTFDFYHRGLDSAYRQTVRRIIPLTIQVAFRAGCSDVRDETGGIVGLAEDCRLEVDPAELGEVARALRSDPVVIADLRYQYSLLASGVLDLHATGNSITDLLGALRSNPQAGEGESP